MPTTPAAIRLAETAAGVFARLVAAAALERLAPVPLLALLKHPLARLGEADGAHRVAIATLEQALLRGPRPRPGAAGLAQAFATFRRRARQAAQRRGVANPPRRAARQARMTTRSRARARCIDRVAAALAPLESMAPRGEQDFAALGGAPPRRRRADEPGRATARPPPSPAGTASRWKRPSPTSPRRPSLSWSSPATMPNCSASPSATAWCAGPARRRAVSASTVRSKRASPTSTASSSAGLVEGVWPPDPRTDPWLNRPMRHALGLDLPERRIGLSAHDFAQLLGAGEVFLTRSAKARRRADGGVALLAAARRGGGR